jgi:dienelactone hydrolase
MQRNLLVVGSTFCTLLALATPAKAEDPRPLPGTRPLTFTGDIAAQLVDGVDRFLLRETEISSDRRGKYWNRDFSSPDAYQASVEPNRARLRHTLGVREERAADPKVELIATVDEPALVGRGQGFEVFAVRWPVFGDVTAEGLLLRPIERQSVADVVAIADADQTPEQIVGLTPGVPAESQFARRLAESGCQVLVPTLINRELHPKAAISNREFLYRSAFELGRHLIGYEVQKTLAAVDWFSHERAKAENVNFKIGVIGWGQGGLTAFYAAAVDSRIDAAMVSGQFGPREKLWTEPIDRNVFGLLEQFGDAEIASLISPRSLIIEAAAAPAVEVAAGTKAGPGKITTPSLDDVQREFSRAQKLIEPLKARPGMKLVVSGEGSGGYGSPEALTALLKSLQPTAELAGNGKTREHPRRDFDPRPRHARQFHELDRHNQQLLAESAYVRQQFMSKLDTSSPDAYAKTVEPYRQHFAEEVIGRFDERLLLPSARSRRSYDTPAFTGYEVVLDVFPDVIAYGILLLPKDIKEGEKRPVVVCQHGLEGRPQDVVSGDHPAYHDFAAKLAERGFITFAPQNLYIGKDRFRTLQRKANPLKKTLFSIIVPQHQQITDWLKTLPQVDPERIGFYGLSYGGKSAMRIPPLVSNYCLSICSADFNEWVWKNASSRDPHSYVWTNEYEIFEFDLGSTFNYAEMAALIAPRPFMVERGHFDGVSSDEAVAYEYAKVFHLYSAKLGLADRCEMDVFVGPHTINGRGTFDFLHKHLNWPKR